MNNLRHPPDAAARALGLGDDELASMPEGAVDRVALGLALMAEPTPPPPGLRARLLRDIGATPRVQDMDAELPGITFVHGSRGTWRDLGIPGVQVQFLQVDALRRTARTLVRMAPGATYPPHRHEATEETLLLAGDLTVEGRLMAPGDYCIAERGTVHAALRTEHGATFMAFACLDDALLDDRVSSGT